MAMETGRPQLNKNDLRAKEMKNPTNLSQHKKVNDNRLPALDLNSSKTIDVNAQDSFRGDLLSQTLAANDFKNSITKKG